MTACLICPIYHPTGQPRLPHFPPCCDSCRTRARTELAAIPEAYALMPAAMVPGRGHYERVSGGERAGVPLNVSAVDLSMPARPGSRPLYARGVLGLDSDQVGDLSIPTTLDTWVRDWADLLRPTIGDRDGRVHLPDANVTSMVAWLLTWLDWALDYHPAIDQFCAEVNESLRSLRGVARAGGYHGEKAGKCPAELRDETRCNTQLYVDPYLDRITCSRCSSAWPRVKWLALRAAQDEASEAA